MTDVIWNTAELDRILRSQHGPVAQDLARRATRVTNRAKVNASGRPGPRVDTGRLRNSISWRVGEDEQGVYADVGTNVEYAAPLEIGWTTSTGRFVHYPFLVPSLPEARF